MWANKNIVASRQWYGIMIPLSWLSTELEYLHQAPMWLRVHTQDPSEMEYIVSTHGASIGMIHFFTGKMSSIFKTNYAKFGKKIYLICPIIIDENLPKNIFFRNVTRYHGQIRILLPFLH